MRKEIIRLVALDLDGTLLNSRKELTEENILALRAAAEAGVNIVPATGRFSGGMPAAVRGLPFVRYAITINGAQVLDIRDGSVIARAELSWQDAVAVLAEMEKYDAICDCYQENWGWMTQSMFAKAHEYAPDTNYLRMIRELRTPVPDLKEELARRQKGVQKVQMFLRDPSKRDTVMELLAARFPQTSVASAIPSNIEVTSRSANKGEALMRLADHLGIRREEIMAVGDGGNDRSMLQAAGIGVAMANAQDGLKDCADYVTGSCDENGAAQAVVRFCLGREESR